MAMPDVFSIRHTSVEAYLDPIVHEIKVRRADLLSDLRNENKRAAYLQLSSECWYVIRAGIAEADEIPPACGVIVARRRRSRGRAPGAEARDADAVPALDGAGAGHAAAGLAPRRRAARTRRHFGVLTPRLRRVAHRPCMSVAPASASVGPEPAARLRGRQALWAALALIVVWGANFTSRRRSSPRCRRAASCSRAT